MSLVVSFACMVASAGVGAGALWVWTHRAQPRRAITRPPDTQLLRIIDGDDGGLPEIVTEIENGQVSRTEPLGTYVASRWMPDSRSSMTLAELLIAEGWNP